MSASKVPQLRFKGFSGEWETEEFGEVVEIIMGQSPSSKSYNSEKKGIPLIQGNADIYNRLSNPRNWTTEKTKECKVDDLILTVRAPVGTVAKSIHNACIGRGVCAIKNNVKSTNEFIYQFLLNYERRWSILEQGSTFTAVSGADIKKILIKIPPLAEQTKIGNYFQKLDKLIEQKQTKHQKLKQLKKAMLAKMFPKDGTTLPEVRFKGFCGEWEEKKLGDESIEIVAGGDIDKNKILNQGKYPVIANALTNDGVVGYYSNSFRIKAPAVTVTGRGDIGHAKARKINFTPVVRLLTIKSKHNVNFLEQAINMYPVTVESTGVPQLTIPKLSKYKIYFPKKDEQTKIGNYFQKLDILIDLQLQELEKLKNIKKASLAKMFV